MDYMYNKFYGACWLLTLISILKCSPVWTARSHRYVDFTGISTFVYPNLEFTRIVKGKDRGYFVCSSWYLKIISY